MLRFPLAAVVLAALASAAVPAPQLGKTSQVGAPAPSRAPVQGEPFDPAVEFLRPYGLGNFPAQYKDALSTLLRAEDHYQKDQPGAAKILLDQLWAKYPTGDPSWGQLPTQPFGLNLGSPPCYYGLRMLADTCDWRLATPGFVQPLRTARLTVILVGQTSGIQPTTVAELNAGTGVPVQNTLDPQLLKNGSAVVHDSLRLFQDYIVAATQGALGVETRILHLPAVDLAVHAFANPPYAGLVNAADVWPFVPQQELAETDWWWLIYPSHVPEQYPAFTTKEFITGGMGTGADSLSPLLIIDDRWLVRKPPHLGSGAYSKVEREVYLPQWLQHEFFHHLYRTWPEFGLEQTPHQWFNLATWPPDFVGLYEADYYHESLHKRLQGATPPLVAGLRYSTAGFPWATLDIADLLDVYTRYPIQNAWHVGSIQFGPQLEWLNQAGVDWNLSDDLANGNLLTGPDCPYYGSWNGNKFDLVPERDSLGDLLDGILGFAFNGELYER